jgi:phage-related protein
MTALFGGVTPSAASQQTQETLTYRVLSYKYGNGYESVLPDGANANVDTWEITFDSLDKTDSASLQAWLNEFPPWETFQGDGNILPSTRTYRITNDGYQIQPMAGGVNQFQFNLAEVF